MKYSFLLFCGEKKKKKETDDPAFIIDQKRKIYFLSFFQNVYLLLAHLLWGYLPDIHSIWRPRIVFNCGNKTNFFGIAHNTVCVYYADSGKNGIETSSSATRRT